MFRKLLESLKEALGAFDVSDSPAAPLPSKPKGPKPIPLKAMRNVQKPIQNRLPGVHPKPQTDKDKFAAARKALGTPGSKPTPPSQQWDESRVLRRIVAEARGIIQTEGGGTRTWKLSREISSQLANKQHTRKSYRAMKNKQTDPLADREKHAEVRRRLGDYPAKVGMDHPRVSLGKVGMFKKRDFPG